MGSRQSCESKASTNSSLKSLQHSYPVQALGPKANGPLIALNQIIQSKSVLSNGDQVIDMEVCAVEESSFATVEQSSELVMPTSISVPIQASHDEGRDVMFKICTSFTDSDSVKESTAVQEVREQIEQPNVAPSVLGPQPSCLTVSNVSPISPSVPDTQPTSIISKNEIYKLREVIRNEKNNLKHTKIDYLSFPSNVTHDQQKRTACSMVDASTQDRSSQEPTDSSITPSDQSVTPSDEQAEGKAQEVAVKALQKCRRRKKKKRPFSKKEGVENASPSATNPSQGNVVKKKRKKKKKPAEPKNALCRGNMVKADLGSSKGATKRSSSSSLQGSSDSDSSSEPANEAKRSSSSCSQDHWRKKMF